MTDWSVAIVGAGAVGRAMQTLFPDAVIYDEPLGLGTREAVNACACAFVCVPTPSGSDGACDTRDARSREERVNAVAKRQAERRCTTARARAAAARAGAQSARYAVNTGKKRLEQRDLRTQSWHCAQIVR